MEITLNLSPKLLTTLIIKQNQLFYKKTFTIYLKDLKPK